MERLSKLLDEELEHYKQIRKQTEEQAVLLGKDDIEAFNSSLSQREELIEKIKGLHLVKEPLMQSYASAQKSANPQNEGKQNNKIETLNRQIREVIEECAQINDKNILTMKEKTEELTKKIDEQSSKRKGIGGYVQTIPNMSEVFDKKT
jgi:flagellar biosynthesis/type III secretory pathway chaperone